MITDERLLLRTLVELADNLVEDFDVAELLTHLADRSVEVLGVTAAGVMLSAPSGELRLVASSSEAMRVLELYELQAEQGPCVECFTTGEPVAGLDLSSATPWPFFAARAVAAGFRSAHAPALAPEGPHHRRPQYVQRGAGCARRTRHGGSPGASRHCHHRPHPTPARR